MKWLIAGAAVWLAGCATVEITFQSDGLKVASFDLQCPADKIEMTVLTRNDGLGCLGSKLGVRGCGKQTTYDCDNARTWHRSAEITKVDGEVAGDELAPPMGPPSSSSGG